MADSNFPPRALARSHASIAAHTMSAAPPAMSNARPLDDVSNIIDLDALHKELEQARSNVEMWMARRELSMKEQVAVHKTNMAVAEEEYVSLVEREKDLAKRLGISPSTTSTRIKRMRKKGVLTATRNEGINLTPEYIDFLRTEQARRQEVIEGELIQQT